MNESSEPEHGPSIKWMIRDLIRWGKHAVRFASCR